MHHLIFEVFAYNPSEHAIICRSTFMNDRSPVTFRSPLEYNLSNPASNQAPCKHDCNWKLALLRFCSPSARSNSSPLSPGIPAPIRSAFRFSQPLSGLLLELPGGLLSCLWHSWGLPCRVFPLEAEPPSRRVWLPSGRV